MKENFFIDITSLHIADNGQQENVNLTFFIKKNLEISETDS